jgi:phosphomannomutase
MDQLIISVSGLRGVIGTTLTLDVAVRYVTAYSALADPGPFIVTRDGRASGIMLAKAIHAALNASGRNTIDAGVAATPTLGVLIRDMKAAGGIQISASHNPPEYNGLKLFSAEGRVIPQAPGQRVRDRYDANASCWVGHADLGETTVCEDPHKPHLDAVLATVNADRIRAKNFNVLLDSNRASGSILGRRLLEALGCRITILGEEPDGLFEHTAEPTAENLDSVLEKIVEAGADVGFCQDPDADRLAVIDAKGRYIGEEYTLALCVDHMLRHAQGPIVMNCASSRMSEDLANKYGVPLHRAAVGEANVVDRMLETNALFGGEGNGGPIDPRVGLVRDSFVGMAQILDAMASREMSVAALAEEIPSYAIVKTKIDLDSEKVEPGIDAVVRELSDAKSDRSDGLRLDWPGRWLLIRASNTEPIVRAIAEAPTEDEAVALCKQAKSVLESI